MYQLKQANRKGSTRPTVQPKLTVGRPGDKYEQEADAVADQVMRMEKSESLQMQPLEEEEEMMQPKLRLQPEEEEEPVQMKPSSESSVKTGYASANVVEKLNRSKSSGYVLPEDTVSEFGAKMGANFSSVRIHTDSNAVQMNQELGAKAFTHGRDIYFNAGNYMPESSDGKHLLAHELTHVVQQCGHSENRISMQPIKEKGGLQSQETPSAEKSDESLANDIMNTQIAILEGWNTALEVFDKVLTSASDQETKPDFNKVVKAFFEDKLMGALLSHSKIPGAGDAFALLGKLTDEMGRATVALESARLRDFYVEYKKAIGKMKQAIFSIKSDFADQVTSTRVKMEVAEGNTQKGGVSSTSSPESDAYGLMRMYLVELRDQLNVQLSVSTPEILFRTLSEEWIRQSQIRGSLGIKYRAVVIIRTKKDYSVMNAEIQGTGGQKIAEQLLKDSPGGVDVFSLRVPRRIIVYADNGWPSAILNLDENNQNTNVGSYAEGNAGAVERYVKTNGLPPTTKLSGG
ncbi:DUF4157 domain-containing protein [Mangrovibacterium sp.]|uniref:eCIS core domain-containing protein n=1 Tax=Mangrovibacterium sp. TaxID=1961364 RepID=UPI003566837D